MKTVLVTGSSGFIGKNLCSKLEINEDIKILKYDRDQSLEDLTNLVNEADFIFHLAGINRPKDDKEFMDGNYGITAHVVKALRDANKKTPILITSSAQAGLDNLYGKSKVAAEDELSKWSKDSKAPVYIYRLPGVFGKWCKPNYNSVVATFCHNLANDIPVQISDPTHVITLVYIDNVVDEFIKALDRKDELSTEFYTIPQSFDLTLGDLHQRILALHEIRDTLIVPNLEDRLNKYLYATYISYLPIDKFSYELASSTDNRGSLTEFIKSRQFGQIFISTTKPGISRGDHWHHTKIEKFFVVDGSAEISFRNKIDNQDIIRYNVSGDKPTVLDIPTGYVHAIKNTGDKDLTTIFWADEMLDKEHPDTYYEKVEVEN